MEAVFSTVFHYNFRPEIDNPVISSEAVHNIGVDGLVKFGDSMSHGFLGGGLPLCDDRRTPASSSSLFVQSEAVVYLENDLT